LVRKAHGTTVPTTEGKRGGSRSREKVFSATQKETVIQEQGLPVCKKKSAARGLTLKAEGVPRARVVRENGRLPEKGPSILGGRSQATQS